MVDFISQSYVNARRFLQRKEYRELQRRQSRPSNERFDPPLAGGPSILQYIEDLSEEDQVEAIRHGTNEANCSQIDWRKGSKEAAGHQGCQEERPSYRRREETPPLQARNCGVA